MGRNYQVQTPTNQKGKACVGATDCTPGEDACPPTTTITSTTTSITSSTARVTSTTTTSATSTTTTNIYHANFMCINKKEWDEKTCPPGGPIIKDLILSDYAGKDL